MNILILGAGGREHAFAWKIAQSPLCEKLYVAPGNAGTAQVAENVDIPVLNFSKIAHFALENQIQLILVGPEAPLVKGIKDFFADSTKLSHIHIIGPNQAGSILEGSKDFAKAFMFRHQIPTAQHQTFTKETLKQGLKYLEQKTAPYVIKADGLAAGKGVIIAEDLESAKNAFQEMLINQKFGDASQKVVIEDFLKGIELSVFVITDGENYKILPEAKDYKRIGVGDTGLNTGGMGAISPVPFADNSFLQKVEEQVIQPTIQGLKKDRISYSGFIFFGLMNVDGNPFVIEYNVRMGDPETQVVMPRIKSDFLELLIATAQNRLGDIELELNQQVATTVVLVSGGYPEHYEKGKIITGLESLEGLLSFHAGTTFNQDQIITNGGRVLAMTALANTMTEALAKSQKAAQQVQFEGKYFRHDIGFDLDVN